MKTLISKWSGVSNFLLKDDQVYSIDDSFFSTTDFKTSIFNNKNCLIIDVASVPDDWEVGKYLYTSDWELNPDWTEPVAEEQPA